MINNFSVKPSDICAVITTFTPTAIIRSRVLAVLEQLGSVVLVNDSGRSGVAGYLDAIFDKIDRVTLINNIDNLGIAASLNIGVREAQEKSFKWIVTLDDDSDITESFISDLVEFMRQCSAIDNKFGAYSLSRFDMCNKSTAGDLVYKRAVITSGCIFSTSVFESVGGFDEDLFIDMVDYDFCTNVRVLGLKVAQSKVVGMTHKIGAGKTINILGCKINTFNHHPFRNYYQVRNSIRFARKYWRFDFLLSARIFLEAFIIPCKAIFFENNKFSRMYYCFIGFYHGCIGRGGAFKR